MKLTRTKSVEQSIKETDEPEHKLKKSLSAWDLTVFGVGVIIGTGIFVLTGKQAALNAGPAVVISFILAAIACGLAAMCYAEFASTVPVAGSAYTFSYATLGELVAWIIGWDLVLELGLGAAVVARGWSAYLQNLFDLPTWLAGDDAIPDFGAIFIVAVLAVVAVVGAKLSGRVTGVLVVIKIAVVLLVIVVGAFYIKTANYHPFIPPSKPKSDEVSGLTQPLIQALFGFEPTSFGIFGVVAAASVVFFAYIGFDIVATAAEETRNPKRDMPRGIIGSLVICTVLYVLVSLVITGMVKYDQLDSAAPLAEAFKLNGVDLGVQAHLARRRLRHHHRHPGADARSEPGAVRDGAGRPAAAQARQGAPDLRDAVRDHDHHGRVHRGAGRASSTWRSCPRWSASARCSRSWWSRPA